MNAQLSTHLVDAVNKAHGRFVALGNQSREIILEAVNTAREIGLYLMNLKEQTPRGEWVGLFQSAHGLKNVAPVLHLDYSTGNRYVQFAKALPDQVFSLPEEVSSVKDVMVMTGILPQSTRGEQTAHDQLGFHSKAEDMLGKFMHMLAKEDEKAPVDTWPISLLENWETNFEKLDPIRDRIKTALRRAA